MNKEHTKITDPEFEAFASDEDYWDHLEQMEQDLAGCREWDCPNFGGAL